jgi:hypothetical protein
MAPTAHVYWLALRRRVRRVGAPAAQLRRERLGTAEQVSQAAETAFSAFGIPRPTIPGFANFAPVEKAIREPPKSAGYLIRRTDPEYPLDLRHIASSPLSTSRGAAARLRTRSAWQWPEPVQFARVGVGWHSGLEWSWQQKTSPSSGLARGIDSTAGQGALAAAGPTLAVPGAGLEVIYLYERRKLVEATVKLGAANLGATDRHSAYRGSFSYSQFDAQDVLGRRRDCRAGEKATPPPRRAWRSSRIAGSFAAPLSPLNGKPPRELTT